MYQERLYHVRGTNWRREGGGGYVYAVTMSEEQVGRPTFFFYSKTISVFSLNKEANIFGILHRSVYHVRYSYR